MGGSVGVLVDLFGEGEEESGGEGEDDDEEDALWSRGRGHGVLHTCEPEEGARGVSTPRRAGALGARGRARRRCARAAARARGSGRA